MNREDMQKSAHRTQAAPRLLRCLDLLDQQRRNALLQELAALDFSEIAALYQSYTADSGHAEKKFQEAELLCPGERGMRQRGVRSV